MTVKVKREKKLLESWTSIQDGRIDTERGLVRGVKILGNTSVHGYGYSAKAMKAAVPLYEGVRVNVDHPSRTDTERKSRSYADRFGRLKNVQYIEGKGLFGDLYYNKNHRLAGQFEYDAKNDPKNLGLSHNARGDFGRGNSKMVESITSVTSVDLVADPATNAGLFESQRLGKKPRVRKQARWEKLMESLGMELGDQQTPREAIAKLLEAIMLDGSLSAKQRKEKILKCLEMDVESSSVNESQDMANEPKPKVDQKTARLLKESQATIAKLQKELDTRKRTDRVRRLCESMEFTPSETQVKALQGMPSKKEAKELIESFMGEQKPKNRRVKESEGTSNKPKSKAAGSSKQLTEAELDEWVNGVLE
jgi:hypothetical protein